MPGPSVSLSDPLVLSKAVEFMELPNSSSFTNCLGWASCAMQKGLFKLEVNLISSQDPVIAESSCKILRSHKIDQIGRATALQHYFHQL